MCNVVDMEVEVDGLFPSQPAPEFPEVSLPEVSSDEDSDAGEAAGPPLIPQHEMKEWLKTAFDNQQAEEVAITKVVPKKSAPKRKSSTKRRKGKGIAKTSSQAASNLSSTSSTKPPTPRETLVKKKKQPTTTHHQFKHPKTKPAPKPISKPAVEITGETVVVSTSASAAVPVVAEAAPATTAQPATQPTACRFNFHPIVDGVINTGKLHGTDVAPNDTRTYYEGKLPNVIHNDLCTVKREMQRGRQSACCYLLHLPGLIGYKSMRESATYARCVAQLLGRHLRREYAESAMFKGMHMTLALKLDYPSCKILGLRIDLFTENVSIPQASICNGVLEKLYAIF